MAPDGFTVAVSVCPTIGTPSILTLFISVFPGGVYPPPEIGPDGVSSLGGLSIFESDTLSPLIFLIVSLAFLTLVVESSVSSFTVVFSSMLSSMLERFLCIFILFMSSYLGLIKLCR